MSRKMKITKYEGTAVPGHCSYQLWDASHQTLKPCEAPGNFYLGNGKARYGAYLCPEHARFVQDANTPPMIEMIP